MLANTPRTWVLGTAVLAAVLLAATWFLLVGPQRAEAADLRQQAADIDASNDGLAARTAQLQSDYARLPERKAELAELRTAMPQDLALSLLTRQLTEAATDTGVALVSIAPGTPVLDDSAALAAAAAPAAPADDATGAPTTAPTAAPAESAPTAEMPVTLQVIGSYADAQRFLTAVQSLPRGFLVTGITSTAEAPAVAGSGKPATENGDVTMTVVGSVFVLPEAVSTTAPAPPDAATPAPAAAPAATTPAP